MGSEQVAGKNKVRKAQKNKNVTDAYKQKMS